jgi:hypothetical protein
VPDQETKCAEKRLLGFKRRDPKASSDPVGLTPADSCSFNDI